MKATAATWIQITNQARSVCLQKRKGTDSEGIQEKWKVQMKVPISPECLNIQHCHASQYIGDFCD
jgi:hypothetical protein